MARRILNRKDLRDAFDASERLKEGEEKGEEEEGEEEDEEADEEEEGDEEEAEGDDEEGDEDEGDEEAPKKKKKPAKPKVAKPVKPKAKPRTRAPKIVRMRVVWGVFNNSNQCVATYDYPKRKDADDHAKKLMTDKRSTHFVQPIKEAIEEKKEKEK